MATILDIDLTNSPGNSYDFFSNKKMSAGTVETEDMKKGQHKTTVEMVDINAYDYGIIDVGIVQFDDTLPYSKKVETAQLRIEYYKTELKDAESWVNALQTEINKVNSELTEYQDQYEESKKHNCTHQRGASRKARICKRKRGTHAQQSVFAARPKQRCLL